MKILISDILLKGQDNSDWKDGYELLYGFREAGYNCDIAGKNGDISEEKIPEIANNYDLIIISENYWNYSGWSWWNWKEIKTPKVFWAIDTHIVDFTNFINYHNIDYVAFNNKNHMEKFPNMGGKKFYLPYGISNIHYNVDNKEDKVNDIVFIGGLNPVRISYINKYNMKYFELYGPKYVREMQRSKICFNLSISDDLNGKNMEIIGSGTFMLSNINYNFLSFMDNNPAIKEMLYKNDNELDMKIKYYLKNDKEREEIAKEARKFIFDHHSYKVRSNYIIDTIKSIS